VHNQREFQTAADVSLHGVLARCMQQQQQLPTPHWYACEHPPSNQQLVLHRRQASCLLPCLHSSSCGRHAAVSSSFTPAATSPAYAARLTSCLRLRL
jgi:hypothetical protein